MWRVYCKSASQREFTGIAFARSLISNGGRLLSGMKNVFIYENVFIMKINENRARSLT